MCYNCVVLVSIVCYTRENLVIKRMLTLSAHPPTDDHSHLCSLTLYSSLEDAKILFSKFVKWGWRFFSLFNFFEKEKLNLRNFFGSKLNLKIEIELPVIKITGITSRDYITYTILIVHAPNLVIMTGNTTIILKIIFTNYRTCFDSLKVLRIISCY